MNQAEVTRNKCRKTTSLEDLLVAKRALKRQLKQFDMDFIHSHRRLPDKPDDKEAIRHLYEEYHAVRSQILTRQLLASVDELTTPNPQETEDEQSAASAVLASICSIAANAAPADSPRSAYRQVTLTELRGEKSRLRYLLKLYERSFQTKHGRIVASFSDIQPVQKLYRRYQIIRDAVAEKQNEGNL